MHRWWMKKDDQHCTLIVIFWSTQLFCVDPWWSTSAVSCSTRSSSTGPCTSPSWTRSGTRRGWSAPSFWTRSSTMSDAQVCSRGRQGSPVTAFTQDTRHTATYCSVSALWLFPLSQVGRWPRLRPAARVLMRFPRLSSPICRGDEAKSLLETAFIIHFGCVSFLVCGVTPLLVLRCCRVTPLLVFFFRRVTPLLVLFSVESRHCSCLRVVGSRHCLRLFSVESRHCLWDLLSGHVIACEICCRVIYGIFCGAFHPKVFVAQNSIGHAEHAHSVRRWCWSAAVCSTGGGYQSRVAPCTDGASSASHDHVSVHVVLGGLPDALNGDRVSVSSSTAWTAVSKSWGWSHQRGGDVGQPMQLTMTTVAEKRCGAGGHRERGSRARWQRAGSSWR